MACSGTPCNPAPSVGSWTFTANPSANRFCDPRLIGLSHSDASAGTSLASIDPVTGCLTRPATGRGTWQHDPDGCQPDYAGPLNNPEFVNIGSIDANKSHGIPMLEADCEGAVSKLIKQVVLPGNLGMPAMLRDECCPGGTRWSAMAPEFLINGRQSSAGTCVSPRMLGFVPYERVVCEGRTVTEYRWFSLDKWQQAEVSDVIEADILEIKDGQTQNVWFGAWRNETCPSGGSVKQLVKIGSTQIKRMLDLGPGMVFVSPPIAIYQQSRSVGGAALNHYPAIASPLPPPIISEAFTYNLTGVAGYKEGMTGVMLTAILKGTTQTALWDAVMVVNGREYARISMPGDNAGANDSNQFIIPITSNIIAGNFYYQPVVNGLIGGLVAVVYLDGFIK